MTRRREAAAVAATVLLAAALWLGANPYQGIDHDARLYTLMAMRWLAPDAYVRDPWFAFGSQDQWSVFSPLFAGVLTLLGVERGALLTTLAAAVLFVAGALALARAATARRPAAVLAAFVVVGVPLCYSAGTMLYVSESFATARGFAVALSLLAAAAALTRRWPACAGLHLAALLLHPAMAAGPLAVSVLCRLPDRHAAVAVGAGVLAFAGLFAAAAAGRVAVVDDHWWSFVEPAILVSIGPWVRGDTVAVLAAPLLLLAAHRLGQRGARRFYGLTALVGLLGVLVSLLAGDRLPVLLLMQAQLWRALWFVDVVAAIAVADLAWRFVLRPGSRWRWPLLALLLPAAALGGLGGLLLALLGASHLAPASLWRAWARRLRPRRRLVQAALALGLLLHLPGYVSSLQIAATGLSSRGAVADALLGLLRTGGWGLLPLLAWWAWRRLAPVGGVIVGGVVVLVAAALWDGRSPTQRFWESRFSVDGSRRMFADRIARGSTVYWHDSATRVWLELGTAGYAGVTHSTGMVFSRQRTLVLDRRLLRLLFRPLDAERVRRLAQTGEFVDAALRGPDGAWPARPFVLASYEGKEPSTAFGIRHLCADPELDFVIDPTRADGLFVATDTQVVGGRRETQYLYDCAMLRRRGVAR